MLCMWFSVAFLWVPSEMVISKVAYNFVLHVTVTIQHYISPVRETIMVFCKAYLVLYFISIYSARRCAINILLMMILGFMTFP